MATRPVFVPGTRREAFVRKVDLEFVWYPGFSQSQKHKSIEALHVAAKAKGISPVLEISGASPEAFGRSLSAFQLRITVPGVGRVSVKSAFQGSKVFQGGGPYQELYRVPPREAADPRLRSSGGVVGFRLGVEEWPTIPKTAFYDWLYLSALKEFGEGADRLLEYGGFTDIQFNPARSLNCQARAAALHVALRVAGELEEALSDSASFLRVLEESPAPRPSQPTLFS